MAVIQHYVLFPNHDNAMRLYKELRALGVSAKISPTPRAASVCCGVSLLVLEEDIEKINQCITELVYDKTALRKAYNYYHGVRDADQFKHIEENFGIGVPTSVTFTPLMKKHIDVAMPVVLDNGETIGNTYHVVGLLNALHEENEQLKEENKILLGLITEILDFIEDNDGVSLDEMKQFWKNKEKELKE